MKKTMKHFLVALVVALLCMAAIGCPIDDGSPFSGDNGNDARAAEGWDWDNGKPWPYAVGGAWWYGWDTEEFLADERQMFFKPQSEYDVLIDARAWYRWFQAPPEYLDWPELEVFDIPGDLWYEWYNTVYLSWSVCLEEPVVWKYLTDEERWAVQGKGLRDGAYGNVSGKDAWMVNAGDPWVMSRRQAALGRIHTLIDGLARFTRRGGRQFDYSTPVLNWEYPLMPLTQREATTVMQRMLDWSMSMPGLGVLAFDRETFERNEAAWKALSLQDYAFEFWTIHDIDRTDEIHVKGGVPEYARNEKRTAIDFYIDGIEDYSRRYMSIDGAFDFIRSAVAFIEERGSDPHEYKCAVFVKYHPEYHYPEWVYVLRGYASISPITVDAYLTGIPSFRLLD